MDRQPTRQEIAARIRTGLQDLMDAMANLPDDKWEVVIGKGAADELKRHWVVALLDGMQAGTITVGDPRLADMLYTIEQSLEAIPITTMEQRFAEYGKKQDPEALTALKSGVATLGGYTLFEAIEYGLTTAGQDLFASQRKSLFPVR